jgi:cysteine desulfurase
VSGKHVYLDFAATTPVDPRVAETMQSCLSLTGAYANPASIHIAGRESYAQVENARHQLAELLGADPRCLIWTSGATESDNLAIVGAAHYRAHRGKHLVTMPTEHKAVTDTFKHLEKNGYEVSWLEPDADGILAMDLLESNIREDTQLVSIMHVNNETGVIQDIRRIGEICRGLDVLFHTDASQSVGKLPLDLAELPIDLLLPRIADHARRRSGTAAPARVLAGASDRGPGHRRQDCGGRDGPGSPARQAFTRSALAGDSGPARTGAQR